MEKKTLRETVELIVGKLTDEEYEKFVHGAVEEKLQWMSQKLPDEEEEEHCSCKVSGI